MHVGTRISAVLLLLATTTRSFPTSETAISSSASKPPREVGHLAFTLADKGGSGGEQGGVGDAPQQPLPFMELLQAVTKSALFQKLVQYLGGVVTGQGGEEAAKKTFVAAVPQADLAAAEKERKQFEASLSLDEAVERVPSGAAISSSSSSSFSSDIAPLSAPAHKLSDESWSGMLFGERGVLTNVFNMMDAQRRNDMEQRMQADPSLAKYKDMDFGKIFDSLLMGGGDSSNLGQRDGPELPEFLGICNRLSCGDIYKAIDQFRKSEFFSNFQTALQLVQDPKGWEILGKMLSNPDMIAQFTGGGAGAGEGAVAGGAAGAGLGGFAEMFGSALGGAKKEAAKGESISGDGDFGTDFSSLVTTEERVPKGEKPFPETSFSIDEGHKGDGKGEDYYGEVVKNIDEDFDGEDLDILGVVDKTMKRATSAPSSTSLTPSSKTSSSSPSSSTSTTSKPSTTTTTPLPSTPSVPTLPPTSVDVILEEDEDGDELAPIPPSKPITSSVSSSSSSTSTTDPELAPIPPSRPIKKEEAPPPMPDFEFSVDEDYDTVGSLTLAKNIDVAPPSVVVDQKVPVAVKVPVAAPLVNGTSASMTAMPSGQLVIASGRSSASTTAPSSTTSSTTTRQSPTPSPSTSSTTPRPTSTTTKPLRRISMTVERTTTPRNHRKDSDYYAMYYDH